MPLYKYVAYTADSQITEGTLDVATEEMAKEAIQRSGFRLLALKTGKAKPSLSQAMPSLFGVKPKDIIIFSRLLATLLERGTDIITALNLLEEQVGNKALREVVSSMVQDLNQGSSFSEAIGKYPNAFPPVYRQLIKVSERTGTAEIVLREIADYMEREKKAMSKVSKAFAYPAFILVAGIGVVGIMMTVVLPSLLEVFAEVDAELPAATKLLMTLTNFFSAYKFNLLGALIGLTIAASAYIRTATGRRHLNLLLLKLPLLGRINLLREMSNFSRTVSMMLKAGITMTETMSMAVQTARNGVVQDALNEVRREMLKGQGLSKPMAANEMFPSLMVQIMMVGEEAGTLGEDMEIITELYTQEIDDKVNAFVSILQPVMLLTMGLMVAFIAIAVIMPMYTVMEAVG